MKLAILAALGLAVTVSGQRNKSGQMSTKGKTKKSKLKRSSKRRPATTFKSASASGLTAQTTEHTTSYESYYESSYTFESHETINVTTQELDDFKTEADTLPGGLLDKGIDFFVQYMKYNELVDSSMMEYEATAMTLTERYDRMVVQLTEAEQVERDFVTDVNNTQRRCNLARDELHTLEEQFNTLYTEYQTALIAYQYMMKDKLHEYRETWMNSMSEQEIFFRLAPLSAKLNWNMDPWEESTGACVDDVYFNSPSSNYLITLTDPFIGRTKCSQECIGNPLCIAFSAEHNDNETGQCIMHMDGPGVYTGDGPRDPGWHCHVNMSREAEKRETYPEYPDDYLAGSSEEPEEPESNAAQLLAMINYMDMLV